AYIASIFAGARPAEFKAIVEKHFATRLSGYYFQSSIDIMRRLRHNGVQTRIVSASPDFFVKGAAESLGIPADWITGVQLEMDGEFLSERIQAPFNYGPGKTERIQREVENIRRAEQTEHVYVLAGFGNSHHTDGHFLDWIAAQKLPDGEPLSVMINGDSPEPDPDWRYVEQRQIVQE
ncbi:MAG: HAD family hydrolase, partial [Leptospirales bacterium]